MLIDKETLPKEFDFHQKVIDIQFAMMMKMAVGKERRLEYEEKLLRELLHHYYTDKVHIDKVYHKVFDRAYYTIPGEFWKDIKPVN